MNNLPIYFLRNNKIEGAPVGAKIIKGSTRVGEHKKLGSAVIVKVHNFYDDRAWVRVWVNKFQKGTYTQTAIFENAWQDENPHWYITYCTGSFRLDQWHEIMDSLRPLDDFLLEHYRTTSTARSWEDINK